MNRIDTIRRQNEESKLAIPANKQQQYTEKPMPVSIKQGIVMPTIFMTRMSIANDFMNGARGRVEAYFSEKPLAHRPEINKNQIDNQPAQINIHQQKIPELEKILDREIR